MKKLLITIGIIPVILPLILGCNKVGRTSVDTSDSIVYVVYDTIFASDGLISDKANSEDTSVKPYKSDSITSFKNISLYWDFGNEYSSVHGGQPGKDGTALIRYIDGNPVDTAILDGDYINIVGEDSLCRIQAGAEKLTIDITKKLPRKIDLRFYGALPHCEFFTYTRYSDNEAIELDYQVNIGLQRPTPEWVIKFINEHIADDIADIFDIRERTQHLDLYSGSPDSLINMARYYFRQYQRLYKNENADLIAEHIAPWYSYQTYVYPVWKNKDDSRITYRIQTYRYMGGAHGGILDGYLTFDNISGRLLGIDDFYSRADMDVVVRNLEKTLCRFVSERMGYENVNPNDRFAADIEVDSGSYIVRDIMLKQYHRGKLYPRPAITSGGMVFTYQKYEKGSGADGTIHLLLPYQSAD